MYNWCIRTLRHIISTIISCIITHHTRKVVFSPSPTRLVLGAPLCVTHSTNWDSQAILEICLLETTPKNGPPYHQKELKMLDLFKLYLRSSWSGRIGYLRWQGELHGLCVILRHNYIVDWHYITQFGKNKTGKYGMIKLAMTCRRKCMKQKNSGKYQLSHISFWFKFRVIIRVIRTWCWYV